MTAKYCVKCGLLCNVTQKVHGYDEDTGDVIYEYEAKCPRYGFFAQGHSFYFRHDDKRYDTSWRLLTGTDYSGA